jgi:hypothetical protein
MECAIHPLLHGWGKGGRRHRISLGAKHKEPKDGIAIIVLPFLEYLSPYRAIPAQSVVGCTILNSLQASIDIVYFNHGTQIYPYDA